MKEATVIYSGKKVLVTGGTGLIGRPLCELLKQAGASVRVASLDHPSLAPPDVEFVQTDLTHLGNCLDVCAGMDFVFHLAGIKGSPAMTAQRPASFFVPTIMFNTNVLEAARRSGVQRVLYTSTIGVYAPAEVFHEDDVWKTFPSPNDRFAGWAKRMGELQCEAYGIEHGWNEVRIVRPANVYGPHDNFDPRNAMVIPSLIARVLGGEDPLAVWGDGTAIRDFIHARDVARGMMHVFASDESRPVNLGSGTGASVREVVEHLVAALEQPPQVVWDTTKPSGDRMRVMDTARARALGFEPVVSLAEGIRETVSWYREHARSSDLKFNVFR